MSLLLGIDDAQRHYIFPNEYEINRDRILVQKGLHQAKLVFIPEKQDISMADKIAFLLEELKETAHEEGKEYLDDAIAFIRKDTFGQQSCDSSLREAAQGGLPLRGEMNIKKDCFGRSSLLLNLI